jgi:hypothetical protein
VRGFALLQGAVLANTRVENSDGPRIVLMPYYYMLLHVACTCACTCA